MRFDYLNTVNNKKKNIIITEMLQPVARRLEHLNYQYMDIWGKFSGTDKCDELEGQQCIIDIYKISCEIVDIMDTIRPLIPHIEDNILSFMTIPICYSKKVLDQHERIEVKHQSLMDYYQEKFYDEY